MARMKTLIILALVIIALCLAASAQESSQGKDEVWGKLHAVITDNNGTPAKARCYLTDPANESWAPPGADNHVTPPERYFTCSGAFDISLPGREYTLKVQPGLQLQPATRTFVIKPGETHEEHVELKKAEPARPGTRK